MSRKQEILQCYTEKGICLYETPEINGILQYIQIRGADKKAPLMLFLHGGPGGSMAGLCHVMQPEWEHHFTVVNWDQRNACKTYLANKSNAAAISQSGTLEDYMADIDAVIAYLHTVYDFEKIILMGFSCPFRYSIAEFLVYGSFVSPPAGNDIRYRLRVLASFGIFFP